MSKFIDSVSFQFFPAKIWEAQPLGELTLRQFLDVHKNPKQSTIDVIEQIKIASKNNDLKLKDSLKQNSLYSFVPSVKLDGNGRVLQVQFKNFITSLTLSKSKFSGSVSI